MTVSIIHEDSNWIVAEATNSTGRPLISIQSLATGGSRILFAGCITFLEQYGKASREDRHDLITEWFHS